MLVRGVVVGQVGLGAYDMNNCTYKKHDLVVHDDVIANNAKNKIRKRCHNRNSKLKRNNLFSSKKSCNITDH